jgi:ornithine cyclodeaminase/alanine dehydrogenase-like protein (mu-crystallin family)
MLYLTEADVLRFLSMRECMSLMRTAFERLASGEAINQPRRRLILPTRSVLHYMAGSDGPYFGAKVYSTNPGHPPHFLVLLYRASDAALLAVIEANHLGQIRTGAATGFATSLLARPDAKTVGIIGSGFQARTQLEAIRTAMPGANDVRVWSRSADKRESFARECGVRVAESAEEAVREADIVVTATWSATPVIEDRWIRPGTHVNAVGSNQAKRQELPAELVRRADSIVVDSVEQSRMESGDLLLALEDEDWVRVTELKDVTTGRSGRKRPEDVSLFKSNGLAVEDVIAAAWVYERAREAGAGREVYS